MASLKKTGLWAILVFFCIALVPSQVRAEEDPIATPSKWWSKRGCALLVAFAVIGGSALAYFTFSNTATEEEGGDKTEQKQENLGKEIPKAKDDGLRFRFNPKPMP